MTGLTRRGALFAAAAVGALVVLPGASSMAEPLSTRSSGSFTPRLLTTGGKRWSDPRRRGVVQWALELERRTSVRARGVVEFVAAGEPKLLEEPFVVWAGDRAVAPLTRKERRGLRQYFELGGVLLVDDADPRKGDFTKSVQKELARVLPESPAVPLPTTHVLFRSFYRLDRPSGRLTGPDTVKVSLRRGMAQVIYLEHDLLGALASRPGGGWVFPVDGGPNARERAIRTAVNIVLYALCSDYKDDQVHATYLMRSRSRRAR
jgi:hypothetical protein